MAQARKAGLKKTKRRPATAPAHPELEPGFRQADLTRALRAMKTMGMPVQQVEIIDGNRRITVQVRDDLVVSKQGSSGYLSIREACAYGKFGRSRAYELIADGTLKVRKFGHKTLVQKASIDRMLAKLPKGLKKAKHR